MADETVTIDDLKKGVHDLTEAVTDMKAGLIDGETVERIAGEVLERQRAANREQQREGFKPDADVDVEKELFGAKTVEQRMAAIHERSAVRVADAMGGTTDAAQVRSFQEKADNLLLLSTAMNVDPRETNYYTEEYLPAARALSTGGSATGAEFVPTVLSGNLVERVNLDLRVVALFPQIEMPSNPFDIPGRAVSRTRLQSLSEQTADSGQTKYTPVTPGTRKITLTAKKFAGEALVSKEEEEDSLIAILPFIQEELVDYLAGDLEDAAINGDLTATHQDSNVTAATDPRKAWKGLRANLVSGGKTDLSNAVLTVAALRSNRGKMGKYGVNPQKLAHIVSINGYIQLLADSSVITMEKYGPAATVLTGELAKADGSPVIVSEFVQTNLNASGVYDGTTTDRTLGLTVHTGGFVVGNRRGITVQRLVEVYAESDQDALVATCRKAFAARFTTSTEKVVAAQYNAKT